MCYIFIYFKIEIRFLYFHFNIEISGTNETYYTYYLQNILAYKLVYKLRSNEYFDPKNTKYAKYTYS